jgi:N-acetylated-alpha-linked acidic dipeptidase
MTTRTNISFMGVIVLAALSGTAASPGTVAAQASARQHAAAAASRPDASPPALPRTVSAAEIEKTVCAINVDRTSSRAGEKKAAAYLEQKLREYGVKATRYDVKAFLSWPVKAELMVRLGDPWAIPTVTPAFGASTPPGGLTAEIVFAPTQPESPDWAPPGVAMRGKILVVPGLVSPESVLKAQEIGAAGLIHINEGDSLHEMIATTIWGTPTTATAERLPRIPVLSIGKGSGDRLRSAAARAQVAVKMVTEVDRGWATIPLVVADVPGSSPEYILVTTHIDSWYEGVTDTAGTVASLLEIARVLQGQRAKFRRGIRFAWWPGHSTGRYAGSTWYVDHFWSDLDRNCVAYTNADIIGVRGSRLDAVEAGGWPGLAEYSTRFARTLKAKLLPAAQDGLFRPGRDSDSSFQGLGIPEFFVRVPGPPRGHADLEAGGRLKYWHTKDDKLDKLDFKVLTLDAQHRAAQIAELATLAVLPHQIGPVAQSYVKALDALAGVAGDRFDLSSTRAAAAGLASVAARLDAAPRPSRPESVTALNRLLVHVTHALNAALYSGAGRFNQDPAAPMPILPALAGLRTLAKLDPKSDDFGFLESELIRGRNMIDAVLREATDEVQAYLTTAGR